ncbi:Gfo/Idh/MocA family protein [Fimbriimonas ginsengisoli]|uniref:Oxidoreductase domain-containing protein n=1 Tax=Fimbriimonas ginsengisoli Gsoil 348 TaxID=661478 RepID=A0A068NR66_FIMGI|nr:Gfo/Idh/MocA family oxidoreductase [Fimbriimonas ginsengisoli]AIE84054.1 oxidoreductase domain-containing protein [Fimbriimonas ginsengisoli Gsoil 348]
MRIVMNGVTGRMGTNQHLFRSLLAIRNEGGLRIGDRTVVPEPILVGRNAAKLEALAKRAGGLEWTTDLAAALGDSTAPIYFDAQITNQRVEAVKDAIEAGKHIYCEKPSATSTEGALELFFQAKAKGVKHGVVQDKLWLPGVRKLKRLIDTGFFGKILSVRGEFGYWVFTGEDGIAPQRPSWNYRGEEGGGIIVDMLCHWRYVLDNLFGDVRSVSCLGATHIGKRWDESGQPYDVTADDSAYATFELEGDVVAHFNSSWAVRVRRDDLLTLQVDGTHGSAVAGLRECRIQPSSVTPRPVWNPDVPSPIDYAEGWTLVPTNEPEENAFRAQWERFLRHVVADEPFPWDLREGAKGVQLAECGLESWKQRRWIDIPELPR